MGQASDPGIPENPVSGAVRLLIKLNHNIQSMKLPPIIFLASGNRDKIEELKQLLHPLSIELKSVSDMEHASEVEEDQPDLKGNALKKATHWFAETGLPALADDTGLEVKALDGAPGVFSGRYAGVDATYSDNIKKLLTELKDKSNRSARFRTVVAFVTEEGEYTFEGECRGTILQEQQGTKGFGYDPVFQPEGYRKTFAELSPAEKNKISHRGKALQKFIHFLGKGEKQPND